MPLANLVNFLSSDSPLVDRSVSISDSWTVVENSKVRGRRVDPPIEGIPNSDFGILPEILMYLFLERRRKKVEGLLQMLVRFVGVF